ncbi:LLM class flavin-dependent oxidoreductase [Solirubrum puertoriconensis]|uniref:Alkanesulfonate monooxygenase n=1 Tax=Solirubrum puertoriconensis TaxID=1751427 RepID=A0A9X0HPT3_SOLP1|nr:LLM class flavin-dependent oxidoreductase [Solirubrum puertoriconensis]KUG09940.1 alkanesulfonate monooxygenase [Solirubrum puertoriconensis]
MPLSLPIESVAIRTQPRVAEIAWFDDLCGGDTQFLSVLDNERRSSWQHCSDITLEADRLGYSNILLPTSYTVGQDVLTFAAGIAPQTKNINLLTAIRTGEIHPPMLARALASLDHMLQGRLTINIINSDLPGLREDPALRYQRCAETIEILRQAWTQERIVHKGELYQFDMAADPAKPYQQNGGPLLYFGGTSEGAREVCAKYCDMFLMWPEKEEMLYETMQDMSARAARYGRQIDFGLRIHVVVRETEAEARAYARHLMSKFDPVKGAEIKSRAQDSWSLGVHRQNQMREYADKEGFVEPLLWTDIGKARSGAGGALVGDPDQIVEKLQRYMDMGMRAFIFSGYPLIDEANLFARYVLPRLPNVSMPKLQGRIPAETPVTPLTTAPLR